MPIIEVDNVSVRFGGLLALRDVSFKVQPKEMTAVIGPNGAGKSTLFNVITGFIEPSFGTVKFNGRIISHASSEQIARSGIARTFQTPEICGDLTVIENIMLGAHKKIKGGMLSHVIGMPWAVRSEIEVRNMALEVLHLVGLQELEQAEAKTLPLGRQRILEVARALASDPNVILLDESASGLNDTELGELATLLKKISVERNATIIFVEHNVRFVMELAQRIVVLNNGELVAAGSPDAIRKDKLVIEAYLGA